MRKALGIAAAWVSVPVIGLLLLFVTTYSAIIPKSLLGPGATSDASPLALNALLGIIVILLLILLTNRVRQKSYFLHLRIGLFIGLGLYGLLLVIGLVANVSLTNAGAGTNTVADTNTCTSPKQQFEARASAIVPIATDSGSGTGFAVHDTSTVLTAYHVVEDAKSLVANYSSGEVALTVIETAPQYDLALLRIKKPTETFFNLSDSYAMADDVYVYGYPGSSLSAGPPSLSTGIISRVVDLASLRMTSQDVADGLEIIQTDAAINPGNSGGPLIGSCGVVGIVSFISDTSNLHKYLGAVSEQNIGFAISAKTAQSAFSEHLTAK